MGQAMSTTQFYLLGRRQSTLTGYLRHRASYEDAVQDAAVVVNEGQGLSDSVDLTGKAVIITGANSGIGFELASYAAGKHASVYMFCRSLERGVAAKERIEKLTRSKNVHVIECDVSLRASVENAVKEFEKKESSLHALVCNAGVLLNERTLTADGDETTFASHFLFGSYYLGKLLRPTMDKKEGRVVFVSSGGMYNTKFPSWAIATSAENCGQAYSGNMAYSYAKRGQVLLGEAWTKEWGGAGPKVISCHPGWVDTPAVEEAYGSQKKYLEPMRSCWQGAEGIAWLMSTSQSDLVSGEFYLDRTPRKKHIAGPFFSPGSFTRNTEKEVEEMMEKLKLRTGV
ncbi:hypothetical protein TrST_g9458 [Triparma strigata]|uniref:Uncharacterized protein n=1 Tax=Triparma strigata TaxID=1606541 RepID=A0A9W7AT27_9STRA|nr:hypothetical protein TrST_g9458 [Triparma strigata]